MPHASAPSPSAAPCDRRPEGAPAAAGSVRGSRRLVRQLARGSVFAAGLVALQFGAGESDGRDRLFDVRMVDRLQTPLTRYRD